MKNGFLVNDKLTCIPGTKTLWHDLLDWIPDLTPIMIDYATLAEEVEKQVQENPPDFIIRNASHFRPMKLPTKTLTISYLQDVNPEPYKTNQLAVCNSSDVVVFNSPYMEAMYGAEINGPQKYTIPIGTDFNLFRPIENPEAVRAELGILPNSVLFVGAATETKGFETVWDLLRKTSYNFCFVMKDGANRPHERAKFFNRVSHEMMVKVFNSCSVLVCASKEETLHLAGVEAAACDLPLVVPNVGIYYGMESGPWGIKTNGSLGDPRGGSLQELKAGLDQVFKNSKDFSPRNDFLSKGLDRAASKIQWLKMLDEVLK